MWCAPHGISLRNSFIRVCLPMCSCTQNYNPWVPVISVQLNLSDLGTLQYQICPWFFVCFPPRTGKVLSARDGAEGSRTLSVPGDRSPQTNTSASISFGGTILRYLPCGSLDSPQEEGVLTFLSSNHLMTKPFLPHFCSAHPLIFVT